MWIHDEFDRLLFICFARCERGLRRVANNPAEIMHFADDVSKSAYRFSFRDDWPLSASSGSTAAKRSAHQPVADSRFPVETARKSGIPLDALAGGTRLRLSRYFSSRLARLRFDLADRVFKGEALLDNDGLQKPMLVKRKCAIKAVRARS